MRLRFERRTQIFDEVSKLTAEYYVRAFGSSSPLKNVYTDVGDDFMVSVMALDRKVFTNFSGSAYASSRRVEQMIAHKPRPTDTAIAFTDARASAFEFIGREVAVGALADRFAMLSSVHLLS
jgi:hypothetical protein